MSFFNQGPLRDIYKEHIAPRARYYTRRNVGLTELGAPRGFIGKSSLEELMIHLGDVEDRIIRGEGEEVDLRYIEELGRRVGADIYRMTYMILSEGYCNLFNMLWEELNRGQSLSYNIKSLSSAGDVSPPQLAITALNNGCCRLFNSIYKADPRWTITALAYSLGYSLISRPRSYRSSTSTGIDVSIYAMMDDEELKQAMVDKPVGEIALQALLEGQCVLFHRLLTQYEEAMRDVALYHGSIIASKFK